MKTIPLTQNKVAFVDDEDFDRVNQFKWHAVKDGRTYYAVRNVTWTDGRRRLEYLHGFLLGIKGINHRDGDGLNCRRENLQSATQQQNIWAHRRKSKGATSRFRGVCWDSTKGKWLAQVYNRGRVFQGAFETEEAAARAYDKAALEHYPQFAILNFPK